MYSAFGTILKKLSVSWQVIFSYSNNYDHSHSAYCHSRRDQENLPKSKIGLEKDTFWSEIGYESLKNWVVYPGTKNLRSMPPHSPRH